METFWRKMTAWAVGSTQLAVPGVQLHPRSEEFWRTAACVLRSQVCRRRHIMPPSAGQVAHNHLSPRATVTSVGLPSLRSARQAMAVTQHPGSMPELVAHAPSGSWVRRSQSVAEVRIWPVAASWLRKARIAHAVGSAVLCNFGRLPHPPSVFCA